jgi:hypothetical protein
MIDAHPKYKSSKMGGVRAVENGVACLLCIGPFPSGLANQDRPSSSRTCLHLGLDWRRPMIPITFDHAPPSTPARNTRPDCDFCSHQHSSYTCTPVQLYVLHPARLIPSSFFELQNGRDKPLPVRVHPQICILNLCGFHRRVFFGGPLNMPEKRGVFACGPYVGPFCKCQSSDCPERLLF